ncbi:PAS domain-containing protein [Pelagibius sp. CAU 1746]|uniref:PAS domain-containing protein n=1 Tax=Pelagibius sp. CAU 1746 TaxID=3140370 RepID=UPI00325B4331
MLDRRGSWRHRALPSVAASFTNPQDVLSALYADVFNKPTARQMNELLHTTVIVLSFRSDVAVAHTGSVGEDCRSLTRRRRNLGERAVLQVASSSFEQRLRADVLKLLYSNWQKLRRGRLAPARSDIDPTQINTVLPHMGLLDVETAPRRYRIRMMGSNIVSWYGCDVSGRYLDEIDFGDTGKSILDVLNEVVDQATPAYMSGAYIKHDGRRIRFERLFLPLCNESGEIDKLITASAILPDCNPILGNCLLRREED